MPDLTDIRRTAGFNTNSSYTTCQECGESLSTDDAKGIAHAVTHYLEKHGWRLLHVGSEWARDDQGKSISLTAAIVGTDGRQRRRETD